MVQRKNILPAIVLLFTLISGALFSTVAAKSQPVLTEKAITIAIIGDFGDATPTAARVAELVKSWQPDYIFTTGDNNYPAGERTTIDRNIAQFYSDYIFPYSGSYESTTKENRFFPSLGNHDVLYLQGKPHTDYFTLPGNERYYDINLNPVHLFVVNSNETEPDGFRADSAQAAWLESTLISESSGWKIVILHHPPYSSAMHGSAKYMRWPFANWGADLVLSGHDHTYERLKVDGLTYVVNGLGGESRYAFNEILPESLFHYNRSSGALKLTVTASRLEGAFYTINGEMIDQFALLKRVWGKAFIKKSNLR